MAVGWATRLAPRAKIRGCDVIRRGEETPAQRGYSDRARFAPAATVRTATNNRRTSGERIDARALRTDLGEDAELREHRRDRAAGHVPGGRDACVRSVYKKTAAPCATPRLHWGVGGNKRRAPPEHALEEDEQVRFRLLRAEVAHDVRVVEVLRATSRHDTVYDTRAAAATPPDERTNERR